MILLLSRPSRGSAGGSSVLLFWNPPVSQVPWPWEGLLLPGLVSSGSFSRAGECDAIHCPLHICLVLGVAQDQVLLPAR